MTQTPYVHIIAYTTFIFSSEILRLHPVVLGELIIFINILMVLCPPQSTIFRYLLAIVMSNTISFLAGAQYNDPYYIHTIITIVLLIVCHVVDNKLFKNRLVIFYLCLCCLFQSQQLSIYELDHTLTIICSNS